MLVKHGADPFASIEKLVQFREKEHEEEKVAEPVLFTH